MLRLRAAEGADVHLWAPNPVTPSKRALCGVAGPAEPGTGRLCPACWQAVSGAIGSAFAGRERAVRDIDERDRCERPANREGETVPDDQLSVQVGIATSKGRREFNADAAAAHRLASTGVAAAVVVDGMGSNPVVAADMALAAQVAVRYGCRHGAMPGVMAAAALLADPLAEFPDPDGVMALAVVRPGEPAVIAHVGDCRAFEVGEDGQVGRLTVDHTKGQRLRYEHAPDAAPTGYDHVVTNSIARAVIGTVALTETDARCVLLTTDGVHGRVSAEAMTEAIRQSDDPQACADALVAAAREAGSRDDATAVVVLRPAPLSPGQGQWGR